MESRCTWKLRDDFGLDIDIDFKTVLLIFLPRVKERLDRALEYIRSSGARLDGLYVASDSDYAPLEKAVRQIHGDYDIRVVADIIGKMADLALQASGVSVEDPGRVHLKDLFGTSWVPKEAASVIRDAVAKMVKAGDIGQANRWQALEYWAAEYLSGTPGGADGKIQGISLDRRWCFLAVPVQMLTGGVNRWRD